MLFFSIWCFVGVNLLELRLGEVSEILVRNIRKLNVRNLFQEVYPYFSLNPINEVGPYVLFVVQWCLLVSQCLFYFLGASHGVDSSEIAFKLAAIGAIREGKLFLWNGCHVIIARETSLPNKNRSVSFSTNQIGGLNQSWFPFLNTVSPISSLLRRRCIPSWYIKYLLLLLGVYNFSLDLRWRVTLFSRLFTGRLRIFPLNLQQVTYFPALFICTLSIFALFSSVFGVYNLPFHSFLVFWLDNRSFCWIVTQRVGKIAAWWAIYEGNFKTSRMSIR